MPPNPAKYAPSDLALAVRVNRGDTYEWSNVLLAGAPFDGTLELLTAAWGARSSPSPTRER